MKKKKPVRKPKRAQKALRKKTVKVDFTPKGYHTLTPYITVDNGLAAVEFYTKAFGAKEKPGRMTSPDGKIVHTEIKIGVSHFMLADELPDFGNKGPKAMGGSPVQFMIYVKNADEVVRKAAGAGAEVVQPVETQFYGDRSGRLLDPFGYTWFISTHVEDVSPKEMERRAAKLYDKSDRP